MSYLNATVNYSVVSSWGYKDDLTGEWRFGNVISIQLVVLDAKYSTFNFEFYFNTQRYGWAIGAKRSRIGRVTIIYDR